MRLDPAAGLSVPPATGWDPVPDLKSRSPPCGAPAGLADKYSVTKAAFFAAHESGALGFIESAAVDIAVVRRNSQV